MHIINCFFLKRRENGKEASDFPNVLGSQLRVQMFRNVRVTVEKPATSRKMGLSLVLENTQSERGEKRGLMTGERDTDDAV